jgi:hypothetical protein
MSQKTGEVCESSGRYRAACACGVERRFQRTGMIPPCPVCTSAVDWEQFQREDTDVRAPKIEY